MACSSVDMALARLPKWDTAVVPTPSPCTPRRARVRSRVGTAPKMPMEPVRVTGEATIRSASALSQ